MTGSGEKKFLEQSAKKNGRKSPSGKFRNGNVRGGGDDNRALVSLSKNDHRIAKLISTTVK
jgi:hypothetical protein